MILQPRRGGTRIPAHAIAAFLIALFAGAFGAVLGIGGGLFIIPSLTLFLGVKLKTAIAVGIVAVIATSLGAGNVYVRRQVADIRLGLLLALATVPGAVLGALLTTQVPERALSGVFAVVLVLSAYRMFASTRSNRAPQSASSAPPAPDGIFRFRREYRESPTSDPVPYSVGRLPWGISGSVAAGLLSGLLGVGGGVIQVPLMTLLMRVPIKVATTTSTYIIGITGVAGAMVYYNHRPSFIDPAITVPVTIGVFAGASIGSRLLGRLSQTALRAAFTVVLVIYAVQMGLRVFGVGVT